MFFPRSSRRKRKSGENVEETTGWNILVNCRRALLSSSPAGNSQQVVSSNEQDVHR